jgi:hypothetical protein
MDYANKSRRVPWGRILLLGCVAAGGLYWAFFRTDVVEDPKPPIALIAGWDDLGACSNMASLDGTRELKFSENQSAEMWDHSSLKEGESDIAQGVWSYDAAPSRGRTESRLQGAALPINAEGRRNDAVPQAAAGWQRHAQP